jgi:hypothetical protein
MLALDRPLGIVSDLALFADHADPKRVFYVPARPQLARIGSAQEMAFVKFRASDAEQGGAGLLSFTTELVASEAQLERARDHLEREGVSEPLLTQVPWISGKAFFAAALEEGDGFVEKLLGEVTPDLAATNRAMFSVLLTEEGARLVEALVRMEGPNPLGVRYELEYLGLRPALDVRIRADYKRIYEELSWGFQFGVAYEGIGVRASVESATQKLRESGAIQVEVLHFTDNAGLQARVDQAVRWFQEKILEDFFKTSLQPAAHENLLERAIKAATQLGAATLRDALKDSSIAGRLAQELGISPDALNRLGQGGGSGGLGGAGAASQSTFALKLQFTFRDIRQEELKSITLDWREAHAERRTAAPQGLLSRIGGPPTIVEAEDSGTFWETLAVNVRPLGEFSALGVHRMVVQLAYPDENFPDTQAAFTFDPGSLAPQRFTAWTNGRPPRYRARTEVHFDEEGAWPGPPSFVGDWQTFQSLELALHPLSDVPRVEVELSPGTLVFAETPQVQVDVQVDGDIVGTYMLTAASPTATFRRRLAKIITAAEPTEGVADTPMPQRPRVEARTTWFLADGRRVEGDWLPVEGTALLVQSPWRGTRTLRLQPLLPSTFLEALVTLTLVEGSRSETVDVRFEPGERRAKSVSLRSLSEEPPPLRVDTLVIRGDGSAFVGQPFETSEPVILVRDRDGAFRQVAVRLLAGPSLAAHGLMAVQVQLLDDSGEQLDTVVFSESQRGPGMLLVPTDQEGAASSYRVIRYALDGTASHSALQPVAMVPELLVPAVAAVV